MSNYKKYEIVTPTLAEIKLSYRNNTTISNRIRVKNASEAYKLFISNWDRDQIEFLESVKLLLMNSNNDVLGIVHLANGGTSNCYIDVKLIFQYILKTNASTFILGHNHPSGNKKASKADIQSTKKVIRASKLFNVTLHDHLIITLDDYTSFSDENLI